MKLSDDEITEKVINGKWLVKIRLLIHDIFVFVNRPKTSNMLVHLHHKLV